LQQGIHVKATHPNHFEQVPKAVQEEIQALNHLHRIGELNYSNSQASKRPKIEHQLLDLSQKELESAEKKAFLEHLQVLPNPLAYSTITKVVTYYIVAILGMIAEFFIYESIFNNSFGMSSTKSTLSGLLVLLFTKYVGVAIQKHIKHWIKENNLRFRSLHKIMIFSLGGLILLNAMLLGVTNLGQIQKQKKIEQMEYLSSSIEESAESGEDTSSQEIELDQLQKDTNKDDNIFFAIARYLSITLIGMLAIGAGATLFVLADLYGDSLRLQKTIRKLKDRHAELKANFEYFNSTYNDLLSLQREIISMHGQKMMLEKLLSKEREKDISLPYQNSETNIHQ
jgi:amino acid transporter